MRKKKIPMRMCLGCRELKPKRELIRIVKNKNNEIFVDVTGKMHGRGAYICKSESCFDKLKKDKKLEKSFGLKIETEIFNVLEKQLEDVNE